MEETAGKDKTPKKSLIKGLKTEYSKIIWPNKETMGKQTAAVLVASTTPGLIIVLIDLIIKFGLSFIL